MVGAMIKAQAQREVAVIARVWGWVAALLALVAVGAGLGALLIPTAFLWLIFGG